GASSIISVQVFLSFCTFYLVHLHLAAEEDEKRGVDDFKGKRKGRADSNINKVKKTVAKAEQNQPASDSSSEDDPEKLWCICRKPHNDRFMIQCDACEDWFHGSCVNVTRQLGRQLEKLKKEWKCPNCQQKEQMITLESKPTTENSSTSAVLQKTDVSEIKHVKTEESHKISCRKETTSSTEVISAKSVPSKVNETNNNNNNALMKNEPLTKKCDQTEERKKANKQGENSYHNGGIPKVINNMEHTLSFAKKKQSSGSTDKLEGKKDSLAKNETSSKSVGRKLSDKKNSINPAKQKTSKDVLKRKQLCVSCPKIASENSCYCSPNCIEKHVADCLKIMKETKGALKGAEFESQRLVVFDHLKGNVIANDNGPTVGEIVSWLKSHPTFRIACASPASSIKKSNSQKQSSDSSIAAAEKKDSNDESSKATVRFNVRKTLKNILMDRCKNADDIQMTEDEIRRIAVKIEEELHSLFKDNSFKYRAKYRSLMFNIKDPRNQGLFRKILTGNIPPDRLVRMSSEELASMELAKWREQENQHLLDMIKRVQLEQQKTGSGLLLKKTHKGEVEIEDDFTNIIEQDVPKLSQKGVAEELSDGDKPEVQDVAKDTTHLHRSHLFDLNCKICTGKIVPPPAEENMAKKVRVAHSISVDLSSPTPVDPVEKSVSRIVDGKSPASSTGDDSMDQEPTSTVSLGSPEMNPKSSSKEIPSKPATSVWKGFISMQDVAKFVTSAYKVSGQTDHLHVDIPDTIQVCGRIIPDQVWDYLSKIKQSGNKELIIVRFQAANEEEAVTYNSFYSYLSSRKRYGVVSNYSKKIKDFYILPLAATSPVPIVLMPFDGPGLPTPRPHLLLGVIVRHKIRQVSPTRISKQNVSEGDQKVVDGSYTPPLETRSYTPPLPVSVDNEGDIVCDSFYSPTADLKIIVSNKESDLTRSASSSTRKLKRKSETPYEPSYIPPVKKLPEVEISPSDKDDDKPYDP
ncbi:death-inducer obliterator 1-like, partial [Stegodyphus dumicola]|uniref:death-inducer obliterator 1-like n=1 Tax=Stegodyphus dumicola TaxID=202533 RepID=UPI0015B310BD